MVSRRKFLGFTGLAAAWAERRVDPRTKGPRPSPSRSPRASSSTTSTRSSTRRGSTASSRPQIGRDAVRGAMELARDREARAVHRRRRHAMGTQPVRHRRRAARHPQDGQGAGVRHRARADRDGIRHAVARKLLEHLAAARFAGEKAMGVPTRKPTGADRLTMGGWPLGETSTAAG